MGTDETIKTLFSLVQSPGTAWASSDHLGSIAVGFVWLVIHPATAWLTTQVSSDYSCSHATQVTWACRGGGKKRQGIEQTHG
jgi:hypothetical protein